MWFLSLSQEVAATGERVKAVDIPPGAGTLKAVIRNLNLNLLLNALLLAGAAVGF